MIVTETVLLVLAAAVVLAIIYMVRHRRIVNHQSPMSPHRESVLRIFLSVVLAFIVHLYFSGSFTGSAVIIAVLVNALLIYAVTHLFDRLVLETQ